MQDCSIFIANALEILHSCTKPSPCYPTTTESKRMRTMCIYISLAMYCTQILLPLQMLLLLPASTESVWPACVPYRTLLSCYRTACCIPLHVLLRRWSMLALLMVSMSRAFALFVLKCFELEIVKSWVLSMERNCLSNPNHQWLHWGWISSFIPHFRWKIKMYLHCLKIDHVIMGLPIKPLI